MNANRVIQVLIILTFSMVGGLFVAMFMLGAIHNEGLERIEEMVYELPVCLDKVTCNVVNPFEDNLEVSVTDVTEADEEILKKAGNIWTVTLPQHLTEGDELRVLIDGYLVTILFERKK